MKSKNVSTLSFLLQALIKTCNFIILYEKENHNLTGRIPPKFRQLTALRRLDLIENLLSGSIPVELGMLQRLEELYLEDNNLENTIPPSLGNCSSLRSLSLGGVHCQ
jgi:Leucine-rich repeat (LRR) protein